MVTLKNVKNYKDVAKEEINIIENQNFINILDKDKKLPERKNFQLLINALDFITYESLYKYLIKVRKRIGVINYDLKIPFLLFILNFREIVNDEDFKNIEKILKDTHISILVQGDNNGKS